MTSLLRHSCVLSLFIFCIHGCSDRSDSTLSKAVVSADNPLAECPSSPNCYRATFQYDVSPERLLNVSQNVLTSMGVSKMEVDQKKQFISAVFTIWLFRFKDDFTLQVETQNGSTYLHLRSASRKGYSDLGVNRHRVNEFVRRVESELDLN